MKRGAWWAVVVCVGWVGVYVVLAWDGVRGKSATMDEPLYAVSAAVVRVSGDYRVSGDNPALWGRWMSLWQPRGVLAMRMGGREWEDAADNPIAGWAYARREMLEAGPEKWDAFLGWSRVGMIAGFGVLGAVVTMGLGWRVGGAGAAVIAGMLYALDPTFLGHGPLVKSDVAFAVTYAAFGLGLYECCKRVTAGWAGVAIVAAAVGPGMKMSGVVVPVLFAGGLLARAVVGGEWEVFGREVRSRGGRVGVAVGMGVACVVVTVALVWGAYGFHYSVRAGGGGFAYQIYNPPVTGGVARAARWAGRAHLLPEAWAEGLAMAAYVTGSRTAYLCGAYSETGWWYYFPVAALFKTPLGGLGLCAVGWAVVAGRARRGGRGWWREHLAEVIGIGMPLGVYLAMAMGGHLNIGIRHLLPVYPLVYAVAAGGVVKLARAARVRAGVLAGVVLVLEVVVMGRPDYIAFFNLPARWAGPVRLLADSNLDWGQDVKGLAEWQKGHPGVRLYAAVYGIVRPSFYGARYEAMPGVPFYGDPDPHWPTGPGVMAVSATVMQGVYVPAGRRGIYSGLMNRKPLAVIGGTIYLYDAGEFAAGVRTAGAG